MRVRRAEGGVGSGKVQAGIRPTAVASRTGAGAGRAATQTQTQTAHGRSSSAMTSAYPGMTLPLTRASESRLRPGPSVSFGGTSGHALDALGSGALRSQATTMPHRAPDVALPGSSHATVTYPGMPPFVAHSLESSLPPEPSAASRSTIGLGFGDVGPTMANTDDAQSARLLFVPGGFPLAFSPAVSRTLSDESATRHHPAINESVPAADPTNTTQSPATDALASHLTAPDASHPTRPGRPQLRKNNSLGLMGTLDSMRPPSLEPTSAFAHVPPMIAKSAADPSAHSQVGVSSRLRPSHGDDSGGAGSRVSQQSMATDLVPPRTQWSSSQGIYVPLMPLPLVTPASSPQSRQADSIPPTPEIGGPSVIGDLAADKTASTEPRPPPARTSPEKQVGRVLTNESAAESTDPSELDNVPTLSVTASKDDSRSQDRWRKLAERPVAPVQATRAVRPGQRTVPAESVERAQTMRTTSGGRSRVQAIKATAALATSRVPAEQQKGVQAESSIADKSDVEESAAFTSGPSETAMKKENNRKRKEPPTSIPTRPTRRGINMSIARPPTARAVRPVIPAIVGAHREFALPEAMIAEVTPVRRARVSSAAASQALGSPTKKRKKNSGLADTGSGMTSTAPPEDENVQGRARRRSTRARSQAPRDSKYRILQ